jgi:magnesium chelatase subunit D
MRADIVVARCAVALAAWHGRDRVTAGDVADAARLALPHRRRTDPLDPPGTDEQKLDEALAEAERQAEQDRAAGEDEDDEDPDPDGPGGGDGPRDGGPSDGTDVASPDQAGPSGAPPSGPSPAGSRPPAEAPSGELDPSEAPQSPDGAPGRPGAIVAAGPAYRPRTLRISARGEGGHTGRRSPAFARRGRVVGSRPPQGKLSGAPHLFATLRAALDRAALDQTAVDQAVRGIRVLPRDLRESVHVGREANLVLFVVDASGSMAARKRMTLVKTAVLSLLRDAYQRRDRIGMITFRGAQADVVLPPTSSHEVGVQRLAALRTGGRTPLAAGLRTAATTIATERRRDPRRRPLLIIVTDGRATSGPDPLRVAPLLSGVATVVVDCESGPIRLGLARRLAAALDADVMPLDHLEAATTRRSAPSPAPATDRAYRRAA